MTDLWAEKREKAIRGVEPLAVRMRPRTIDEFAGQKHILAPGKLLWRMLQAEKAGAGRGALTSIILHGPPGTGKTTLAELIARHTNRHFERENAASVGVARIREISDLARKRLLENGKRTVLFLDEIHRFSRAQQDVLLADVERGVLTLIGATTENPLFAVNSALVSRSTLFRLESLTEEEIIDVLRRAIADPDRGYGKLPLQVTDDALRVWAIKCDGDARRALTALEVAVLSSTPAHPDTSTPSPETSTPSPDAPSPILISRQDAEDSIQQKAAVYDHSGDQHYDAASAMIKSVRGSDPDAAIYWIAMMLEAGEDVRFIARRLAILASEDIGNADPRGIMVAAACWELVERVGMPEARIILAQCATYLALAPKSNAAYNAINAAMADVKEGRTIAVPMHIKDGNVRKAGQKSEGSKRDGEAYAYAHTDGIRTGERGVGMVGTQDYLGVSKSYYQPTEFGAEKLLKERLEEVKRLRSSGGSTEQAE